MNDGIFCLMISGGSLTDEVRTLLYRAACEMHRKGQERKSVKSSDCEALVQTKFQFAMLGSIYGTKFTADVETQAGKTRVHYIVQSTDLERALEEGVWDSLIPLPQDHPASNAWLN